MAGQTDEKDFAMSPDSALGQDLTQDERYDDPSTDFNNKQLDPDINSLFPDEPDYHIRWKGETEEQQHARTEAATHAPPQHSRYYSQDGNKPAVRSGSIASNGSSQAHPDPSDASSKDLDQIDMGGLFRGGKLAVVNTDGGHPGADRPAGLNFVSAGDEDTDEEGMISSATFVKTLESSVQDPDLLSQLKAEFNELNARKNYVATEAFRHLQKATTDYNELKSDYYSGPGDERRRIREEANLRAKERKKAKKERMLQMALGGEIAAARLAKSGVESGGWDLDPVTGLPISPETAHDDGSDDSGDEEEDGDDDGRPGEGEFYSDDEEGEKRARALRVVNGETARENDMDARQDRDGWSDEWPGDRRSRVRLSAIPQDDRRRSSALLTGNSLHSYSGSDKPLPSIPSRETEETIVGIHILIRLLPIKVALIMQMSDTGSTPNPQVIYTICERADEVLKYAQGHNTVLELQGRCWFYVGVAEYLRFTVDRLGDEELERHIIRCFEDARDFCGEVLDEGAWGAEWAEVLNGGQRYSEQSERSNEVAEETAKRNAKGEEEKVDRNLVTRTLKWMMNWSSGEDKSKSTPTDQDTKTAKTPPSVTHNPKSVSNTSSFGARFAPGQGQRLQRPGDVSGDENVADDEEEEEEEVPNNLFGGMVPIADLPQAPPKKQKPIGLGIEVDGMPLEVENTILSPSEGVFESPEKYASGFGDKPTVDKVVDFGDHSPDSAPSPHSEIPPTKRYRVQNPDTPSTTATASSKEGTLPPPVATTSPTVSPGGGSSILGNLTRRFSSLALSPTANATSPTSPEPKSASSLPTHLPQTHEADDEEEGALTPNGSQRLSLRDRRRSSAIMAPILAVRSIWPGGKAAARAQDSLIEAEEGNSPLKQDSFDRDEAGRVKKSPLSPPGSGGDESGMRTRRSAGRGEAGEDMV